MPPWDGNCVHRMVAIFVRWTSIPGPASALYRLVIPAVVLPLGYCRDAASGLSARKLPNHCHRWTVFALDLAFTTPRS